jgi:hypothetical protein
LGVQVTFSFAGFQALFPQFFVAAPGFTPLTELQVTGPILTLAEQYCRNDGGGPVCSAASQTNLLNLMVAHVAQLLFGSSTQPLSPIVGRINTASEGSVSLGADFPDQEPSAAWYNQTQYGAMFWAATKQYRTGFYIPGPRRIFNPLNIVTIPR